MPSTLSTRAVLGTRRRRTCRYRTGTASPADRFVPFRDRLMVGRSSCTPGKVPNRDQGEDL